jgi:phospho-N-acetylmuramoyl-pentapeptide-transferase
MPLLLVFVGMIFYIEAFSVMLQVMSFKLFKKRIFKMSPIHHHFEMCGWNEIKIVVVFSLVTLVLSAIGSYGFLMSAAV